MESVRELINQINKTRTQVSSSCKDEIDVMRAMLNDKDFKVDVYGKNGIESTYSPYEESRTMVATMIQKITKINNKEAVELANSYDFGKQESTIMVGLAKEYINTYLETGRKLPLGGRAESDISISKKIKEARVGSYPKKVGVNDDGTDKYVNTTDDSVVPSHGSIKVYSPCPKWLKK